MMENSKVEVTVVEAKDLATMNISGDSDPYVIVKVIIKYLY